MWSALVDEFTKKSMWMESFLLAEFMNMRYEKGADLREQFDKVRMKYESLLNFGITVSDDCYRSLVINFVPDEISSFLALISATMKARTMRSSSVADGIGGSAERTLDAEVLMQLAAGEWDRQQVARRTEDVYNTAPASISEEERGVTYRHGKQRRRGKSGRCWNCGGRGHKKYACPSPIQDIEDSSGSDDNV